jgi:glycosyltransferase involved in cell wall biosynthesis
MNQKISVVINTLNEEKNIPYTLRSVHGWVDEIIVVDMYSDDRTAEIARQYGAKVFFHERIAAFDGARQFAIDQASNEWILVLDADELIPEPLSRKLLDVIAENKFDVVIIPRLNYLLGAALMHTGWGPNQDKHPRLFRKGMITASSTIHEFFKPVNVARILELDYSENHAIVHFNYINTTHFIEKLNRYTSVEASQAHERAERASFVTMIYTPMKEFISRYIKKSGWRDGWRGFYLSFAMVFYRLSIFSKMKELENLGSAEDIKSLYLKEAERLLAQYGRYKQ